MWWLAGLLALAGIAGLVVAARRRRAWPLLAGAALIALAGYLAIDGISHDPDPRPPDPNPGSSLRIAALGDSFISGEGAQQYLRGTDEPGENMCHRAATAYPYLAAEALDASLTFVSCSGATTAAVTGFDPAGNPVPGQQPESPPDVFGGRPQVEVLEEKAPFDVVLISIGGNDAGFAEIGVACAVPGLPDCRRSRDRWLRRLDADVRRSLARTYAAVRRAAPGAEVFAMTYPNPLGPVFCNDLAGLNEGEMAFLRDEFVGRLNGIVEAAAEAAGVSVIDLTQALDGYRFCERPPGQTAVNFIALNRTRGARIDLTRLGSFGRGTLHPNELGHELIEQRVLPALEAFREAAG